MTTNSSSSAPRSAAPGPLAGTTVLDCIDGLGAYGPRLLVGLGAEVIRIEPPSGSAQRRRPPLCRTASEGGEPGSLYFLHHSCGKKGVTLDFAQPDGRALLERLIARADVIFDSGQLDRIGLRPETLAERGRIVVSITPFGLRSARAHWLGEDLICQAMSGMIGLHGYHGERPARFGPEQASEMSGLAAAFGALIALFGARRGGGGEFVDIAAQRVGCLATLQLASASLYHQFGRLAPREKRPQGLPAPLLQASDGYVQLRFAGRPEETLRMLEAHGAAGELRAILEQGGTRELARHPEFRAAASAFVAARTRAQLMEIVPAHGIQGLAVHDARDIAEDPYLEGRAFFAEVELPGGGRSFRDLAGPFHFSRTPWQPGRRPPLLGEHNADVYGGIGLDAVQRAALHARGVI